MKKIVLYAIAFLLLAGTVLAPPKGPEDIFKSLDYNGAEGVAIFTVQNPNNQPFDLSKLTIHFNETDGKVNSYTLNVNASCNRTIYNYANLQHYDPGNVSNGTEPFFWNESVLMNTTISFYECYKPSMTLPVGTSKVKLTAELEITKRPDGTWGYNVDWLPTIEFNRINYTMTSWAWWNVSYAYRRFINTTNIANGVVIVVNGTNGVTINGTRFTLRANADSDLWLYYNNATSYAVVNGSAVQTINYALDTGLQAYYTLDENMLLNDSLATWNANDSGGTAQNTSGYINDSRHFFYNGSYFYNAPIGDINDITILLWTANTKGTDTENGLVQAVNTGSADYFVAGYDYEAACAGGSLRLFIHTSSTAYRYICSPFNTTAGVWYHHAIQRNGVNVWLWTNGTNMSRITQATGGTPSGAIAGTGNMGWGWHYSAEADKTLKGDLDEIKRYNRILTSDEINDNYNNGLGTAGYGNLEAVENAPTAANCWTVGTKVLIIPSGCYYPLAALTWGGIG